MTLTSWTFSPPRSSALLLLTPSLGSVLQPQILRFSPLAFVTSCETSQITTAKESSPFSLHAPLGILLNISFFWPQCTEGEESPFSLLVCRLSSDAGARSLVLQTLITLLWEQRGRKGVEGPQGFPLPISASTSRIYETRGGRG